MSPLPLRTHAYVEDPTVPPAHDGRTWCTCGRVQTNPVHQVPDTHDADAETRRRTGEKD